jgi:opacity protein-like surface antigen
LAEEGTGNMVFFRGGFVGFNSNRGGEFFTDCGLASGTCSQNNDSTGWYVGAGLDLVLSKNMWGGMDKTWAVGEIGVQFNRISSHTVTGGVTAATGSGGPAKTQLTSVTIDVAPKIKFMEGSAFRPWIIPVGLDIMVISPPSNQTQYLDVGVEFGVGVEYEVWKAFKLGLEGRYHLMANMTNTTNSYGQVGPYVGISF